MFQLSESAQSELLALSRTCLEEFLKQGRKVIEGTASSELHEFRGVFVTLHRRRQLCGCIGVPEPVYPLFRAVQECTISAATADPRFAPVTAAALPEVRIEISVLSPLEPVGDIDSIVIGKHGLILSDAGRRGLLLPQVPVEHGWDRETFLERVQLEVRVKFRHPHWGENFWD